MRIFRGFTLTELVVVLVILGIMASMTFGAFGKEIEKERCQKAIDNIKIVYNMEKRYRLDNGQYFPNPDASAGTCLAESAEEINKGLNIFIRDTHFSYAIQGVCAGTTTGYSIVATRADGPCAGGTVSLTQAGGEPVISACARWN